MQKQVARCLSYSEISDTELYGSVVPRGFGWTESIRPVRPSSSQRKHLSLVSAFFLIQLHSMTPVLDQHPIQLAALFCDSRTKPIRTKIQKNPSWKLMSKGEREITSKLNHFYRGGEYSGWESYHFKRPQMLGVQEERSHMSLRGERHVHIYLVAMPCAL